MDTHRVVVALPRVYNRDTACSWASSFTVKRLLYNVSTYRAGDRQNCLNARIQVTSSLSVCQQEHGRVSFSVLDDTNTASASHSRRPSPSSPEIGYPLAWLAL